MSNPNVPHKVTGDTLSADEANDIVDSIKTKADSVDNGFAELGDNGLVLPDQLPTAYELPIATSSVLGGVKQGSGVTIAGDGTLSVSGGSIPSGGKPNDVLINPGKWLNQTLLTPIVTIDAISNLITNFDFSDTSTVTLSGNLIQTITDKTGSVVNTASGGNPVFMSDSSLGKGFFARFTGVEQLVGALLAATGDYTLFVVRRIASNAVASGLGNGVFQNGSGNGYGLVDFQDRGDGVRISGGFYPGVSVGGDQTAFINLNKWEVIVTSHASGQNNKQYNSNGTVHVAGSATPHTPTTSNTIGGCSSANNFKGDIAQIMLYSRQLTDAETQTVCNYLTQKNISVKPQEIVFDGHSKMTAAGGSPDILDFLIDGLRTAGYYISQYNAAVGGRTYAQVIQAFTNEVVNHKASNITSVFAIMCGYNDVGSSTAAVLIQDTISMCTAARALGYKVVIFTELLSTQKSNTDIITMNNYILAHWADFADAFIDTNSYVDYTNTTLVPDGIHMSSAGSHLVATPSIPVFEQFLTL